MKAFKQIGMVLLGVLVLLVIVAFFLPSTVHVERSVLIRSQPGVPFTFIDDLRNWDRWSPWHQIDDSNTEWVYSDNPKGKGAWYTWSSSHPKVGNGKLTIIESVPASFIGTEMDFGNMGISRVDFKLEPADRHVKVTWSFDCEGRNVPWTFYTFSRYFYLFMDKVVGEDLESGLNTLKTVCEAAPAKEDILGFRLEHRVMAESKILSVREKVTNADISSRLGEFYGLIGGCMKQCGAKEAGQPIAIWHHYDSAGADMEAAIPVSAEAAGKGKVKYSVLPATKAIVISYYGSYEKCAPVYEAVRQYISRKGMRPNGPPREIYITDPGVEKDTARWLTEMVFPVL